MEFGLLTSPSHLGFPGVDLKRPQDREYSWTKPFNYVKIIVHLRPIEAAHTGVRA